MPTQLNSLERNRVFCEKLWSRSCTHANNSETFTLTGFLNRESINTLSSTGFRMIPASLQKPVNVKHLVELNIDFLIKYLGRIVR